MKLLWRRERDVKLLDDVYGTNDGWTIITLYERNNPANRGIYISGCIEEYHCDDTDYYCDWESALISAPYQKFERYLIDKRNKIIFQKPYVVK